MESRNYYLAIYIRATHVVEKTILTAFKSMDELLPCVVQGSRLLATPLGYDLGWLAMLCVHLQVRLSTQCSSLSTQGRIFIPALTCVSVWPQPNLI